MVLISRRTQIEEQLWVRPADAGEEAVVLDVLAEAAGWLRSRGIRQWPARFPVESVTAQIAAAEAFLVEDTTSVVATFAASDAEPGLWPDAAERAVYVSRLAVVRRAAGADLGARLLAWIERVVGARGGSVVRLATSGENADLRRYYERIGFVHVGDPEHARRPTSLYERPVGRH